MSWTSYASSPAYDEMLTAHGKPRRAACAVSDFIDGIGEAELRRRQLAAENEIRVLGVTFSVYSQGASIDREWPFDIIPRVIGSFEWERIERGLKQRLTALNLFIDDLYNDQLVILDRVFPDELLRSSRYFRAQCCRVPVKFGIWAHICGSDLVRGQDGTVFVLEDNLRVPSGVSYMLENRAIAKRVFPELFEHQNIQPVDGYTTRLYSLLASLAPRVESEPRIALLTPGIHNSAFFEHSFLAQQMGVTLVQGRDLVVLDDDCLYMRTIGGLERVHVLYRRVDDDYLDPEVFLPESQLGCRGLMRAWREGNVALVNAPGSGVADDKVVYSYVPDLIHYYLGEEPILPNVETYRMFDQKQRQHVLSRLEQFVVKPANESGGYGIVVGDSASEDELANCRQLVEANPRNFIAQPIVRLSTAPTLCEGGIEPRHLDLRPFVLSGSGQYVTRGGLTRVARRKGSLIVNSSQGGGSKDTWVVSGAA
jgi:uncharacterized circularly permuted ATP-grasp superfamily protein